jgi:cytidine deaminase
MSETMNRRDDLIALARTAATGAYAPYSNFHVGAALLFADGSVVTGANVENASYGLALCAETVAVGKLLSEGGREALRGGLVAVAVTGGAPGQPGAGMTVTPCGRCRQILNEVAQLGSTDPVIWCDGSELVETKLSVLLPHAFGPANLA